MEKQGSVVQNSRINKLLLVKKKNTYYAVNQIVMILTYACFTQVAVLNLRRLPCIILRRFDEIDRVVFYAGTKLNLYLFCAGAMN